MYQNLCRFRCSRTCADSSVTSPTATYADSTCAESPRTYAASPRARHFGPFGVDRCIRPAHVVCIWTPRTQLPSIFDGDLFFLDEFEREPMDLTMPRLNSCVKKSIGFKPIQPMDLSVNSSIGQ
ncbi:hypothetical protein TNCV_109091 [Trichonephila clavipes]|nr:hypothetical protein TNCV_109091 [Trichonephila clavipes]